MTTMNYSASMSGEPSSVRSIAMGARLSTATSTIMTVLLLASIGQGFLSVALLSAAGLGFELLKWHSWQDAWSAHYRHQNDRRNVFAVLCAVAVVLSIGASVATTRSSLAVNASDYLQATRQQELINTQIDHKQSAIESCIDANRITLCARPLQEEVSELQAQLAALKVPAPDEATALISEVASLSGLPFNEAATLVVMLISVMLDASGLYFLYKTSELSASHHQPEVMPSRQNNQPESKTSQYDDNQQINLSVTLGVDDTLRQAMELISSGKVRPSIRSLSDSLDVPQHTAQTILHWLSEAGHLQKQGRGKGYTVAGQQRELL